MEVKVQISVFSVSIYQKYLSLNVKVYYFYLINKSKRVWDV